MNKFVISPDALIRFRNAASQIERGVAPRVSRWLILKDDIGALRKRGISYRVISELLSQNGITASPSGLMRFCRQVLKEKRSYKLSAKRRVPPKRAPDAPAKTMPPVPAFVAPIPPAPTEPTPVKKSRGPHIAKLEFIKPEEPV